MNYSKFYSLFSYLVLFILSLVNSSFADGDSKKYLELTWPDGDMIFSKEPIIFSWYGHPRAENYVIKLYKTQGDKKVSISSTKLNKISTNITLGGVLSPGQYSWSIEALAANSVIESAEKDFRIVRTVDSVAGDFYISAFAKFLRSSYTSDTPDYHTNFSANIVGPGFKLGYHLTENLTLFSQGYWSTFTLHRVTRHYDRFEFAPSYQTSLSGPKSKNKFILTIGPSFSYESIPEAIAITSTNIVQNQTKAILAGVRARLKYGLDDNTYIYGLFDPAMPLSMSGGANQDGSDFKKQLTLRAGTGVTFNKLWPWGINFELLYFKDGYQYTSKAQGAVESSINGFELSIGLNYHVE